MSVRFRHNPSSLTNTAPDFLALSLQPDFIEMLGLKQSLTPSRNNGFLNMLRLMQRKALELAAAQAQVRASWVPRLLNRKVTGVKT